MAVTWNDLAFVPDPALAREAQAAWSWLVPGPWRPLVCAMVGGIFFATEAGDVRWLDTGTGAVETVAASVEAFEEILRSGEPVVEEWFLPGLVEALHEAGKRPGPGEGYWFLILPVFAEGEHSADKHGDRAGSRTTPGQRRHPQADRGLAEWSKGGGQDRRLASSRIERFRRSQSAGNRRSAKIVMLSAVPGSRLARTISESALQQVLQGWASPARPPAGP